MTAGHLRAIACILTGLNVINGNHSAKTVLREKDKKKDRGGDVNKENPYNKIADDICGKYDIVSYYSNFYRFNGTYYKPMTEIELERIIHLEVNHNIGHAGRKEIIEFLKLKTQVSIVAYRL